MKVWYELPPVDSFDVANQLSSKNNVPYLTKDYDKNINISILRFHMDIVKPMLAWMDEMGFPQKCMPTINHQRRFDTDQFYAGVSFDLPEEHAILFLLKFGKGYNHNEHPFCQVSRSSAYVTP